MIVKFDIGGKTLAQSGSAILGHGQVAFSISIENIVANFVFQDDDGSPEIVNEKPVGNTIRIILKNWKNPLGTSYLWENIATVNGLAVSIGLYVSSIGPGDSVIRLVNYSVYTG